MPKTNYHQTVAEAIIKQLKQGTAPWVKPWQAGEVFLPHNPSSGKNYRGANAVWLMSVAEDKGFSDPRWLTYKQAQSLDAQVNKGEKGSLIEYYKWQEKSPRLNDNGEALRDEKGAILYDLIQLPRPEVFRAVVFNAQQMNGLPQFTAVTKNAWERHSEAESILRDSGASIQHIAGNRAFYRPSTDSITLPLREQFPSADNYYATALHELGHASGHSSRLNRDLSHPFGSQGYAKEELRAEIASLMIGQKLGIGHEPGQHVAYIDSWISALEKDHREIFRASTDAERITNYLINREMTVNQDVELVHNITVPQVGYIEVEEVEELENVPEKIFISVPYKDKEEAKALGAKWDKTEKSWFAPNAEAALLERWGKTEPLSTLENPEQEFSASLRSAGLILPGSPIMDGQLYRVPVEGDSKGQTSGAYVGFSDGHPAGYIHNYKTGFSLKWKSALKGAILNPKEKAALDSEYAKKQEEREKEKEAIAQDTAAIIGENWIHFESADTHLYLDTKGVQSHGLKTNTLGALQFRGGKEDAPQHWSGKEELLVPVMDIDGNLWAAQSIDDQGRKSFPRGSKLQGGHFVLGTPGESETLLISEGYSTGATVHELTGLPVVIAFHSGNLPAVAEAFREKYPEKNLVIAGDDDHQKPLDKNVGRIKAEEAALAVNGYSLFPKFEKTDSGTDWNDFMKKNGKEDTQKVLSSELSLIQLKNRAKQMTLQNELIQQKDKKQEQHQLVSAGNVLSL